MRLAAMRNDSLSRMLTITAEKTVRSDLLRGAFFRCNGFPREAGFCVVKCASDDVCSTPVYLSRRVTTDVGV